MLYLTQDLAQLFAIESHHRRADRAASSCLCTDAPAERARRLIRQSRLLATDLPRTESVSKDEEEPRR